MSEFARHLWGSVDQNDWGLSACFLWLHYLGPEWWWIYPIFFFIYTISNILYYSAIWWELEPCIIFKVTRLPRYISWTIGREWNRPPEEKQLIESPTSSRNGDPPRFRDWKVQNHTKKGEKESIGFSKINETGEKNERSEKRKCKKKKKMNETLSEETPNRNKKKNHLFLYGYLEGEGRLAKLAFWHFWKKWDIGSNGLGLFLCRFFVLMPVVLPVLWAELSIATMYQYEKYL